MPSLRLFIFIFAFLLVLPGISSARLVRTWSDQELFDKSDLVVIATPVATSDTKERGPLSNFATQPVIGVETTFAVFTVLKGDQAIKHLVLHHYRPDKLEVPNAPTFLSFDPAKKKAFHLFLVRQPDGRYAPAAGQIDPDISVKEETAKRAR